MGRSPADFESAASASSAIPAGVEWARSVYHSVILAGLNENLDLSRYTSGCEYFERGVNVSQCRQSRPRVFLERPEPEGCEAERLSRQEARGAGFLSARLEPSLHQGT